VLVGILLLFGIARTVLRVRRRRKGTDAAAPGRAEGETADGSGTEAEADAGVEADEAGAGAEADEAGVPAATDGDER
jgi:hypothetical protein